MVLKVVIDLGMHQRFEDLGSDWKDSDRAKITEAHTAFSFEFRNRDDLGSLPLSWYHTGVQAEIKHVPQIPCNSRSCNPEDASPDTVNTRCLGDLESAQDRNHINLFNRSELKGAVKLWEARRREVSGSRGST